MSAGHVAAGSHLPRSLLGNLAVAGVLTFTFFGAIPCGLIIYFAGSRVRRERRRYQEMLAERQAEQQAAEDEGKPEA